jgi:hypothetical protein
MQAQQLDFISGYNPNKQVRISQEEQLEFIDSDCNIVKQAKTSSGPQFDEVNRFFNSLDYEQVPRYVDYWKEITPKDDSEIFQRWLFAFMSVHTSWKSNVAGYLAIKDWYKWLNKWDELLAAIEASKVGLQKNRVRFISEFSHSFWKDPSQYKKQSIESWTTFRNRLKDSTLGLGPAKASFAIEMCYPTTAKLCCFDTHMFQAYGLNQTRDAKYYSTIENHWVEMSNMWNIPAYIARCLYWDIKQGYLDSRYWSYVFEETKNQNKPNK